MELIVLIVRLFRWLGSDRTAQQQQTQLTPEQVRRILAARAAAAKGTPIPQGRPQPARMVQQQKMVKKAAPRRVVQTRVGVAAPILTPVKPAEPTVTQMVAAAIKPVAPVQPAATAGSIKKWLNPATLRQQFILTEVLQPPMALRETYSR